MPRGGNTRDRLIKSAIELTAGYGIENVTVRRIAEMLDYSEATLYRHFGSRDELLVEALMTVDARISARFLESPWLRDESLDVMECIHHIWRDVYRYLIDNPSETMFILRFRYSSLYTEEVRARRKSYDGSFEEPMRLLGRAGSAGGAGKLISYKGFLPNYIFELTLCFAEKVIAGRVPDTPEAEEKLWSVIVAACASLSGPEPA